MRGPGVLFALLAIVGCAHAPLAPAGMIAGPNLPARLYCVQHDSVGGCAIYRSAQPSGEQFEALAEMGVRSDLKLNSALEGRDETPRGMERLEHPWSPIGPVDHDDVASALADLELADKPVLIHCTHGIDRTGLLVALYRVRHGSSAYAAWMEWLAYGHVDSFEFRLLRDAFTRETGFTP